MKIISLRKDLSNLHRKKPVSFILNVPILRLIAYFLPKKECSEKVLQKLKSIGAGTFCTGFFVFLLTLPKVNSILIIVEFNLSEELISDATN